tara:strand:+ start:1092 stop:1418 length:327 start_codon:yes stop_codon:yes gene_type:complete
MKEGKKRGTERTQIATRNEEWADERLKSFLDFKPPAEMPQDYNVLLKAYRGMTAELFDRFIPLFQKSGKNLNCALSDGSTFLDLIQQHRKSEAYVEILKAAGAVKGKS